MYLYRHSKSPLDKNTNLLRLFCRVNRKLCRCGCDSMLSVNVVFSKYLCGVCICKVMQVEWEIEGRVGQAKSRIGKPTDQGTAKPSWRVNAQEGQQKLRCNDFVDVPLMLMLSWRACCRISNQEYVTRWGELFSLFRLFTWSWTYKIINTG